ncbi:DNA primase [Salicibibacter cibarius]|uniref:DNA primase n=1 Tax=Salicibibacter cibarius TaxID=2743000 RepID=A0A7T6Z1C7_9BACI|nr:phage/plasmid primase, P4 family [Salicibibacter cibarius]QQK75067.1 DNA primase [Salicibibacter cibarius]QQK75129.1 DNA primase [Salicibibacter cibarius]
MYVEFKAGEKHAAKGADIAETHDAFQDAGYILTTDDLVVDIDDLPKETIQNILDIFNIRTERVWTTRGVHLYFKKPDGFKGASKVIPLGFNVEFKHNKNTYATAVKQNGEERLIENPGIREDLPSILHTRKTLQNLQGLSDGDGRNNAMFNHRVKIQGLVDNWEQVLRFINNHIFADPLSDQEFQTLARDDIPVDKKDMKEPDYANLIMRKYNVVMFTNNLYFRLNDEYTNDEHRLRRMVANEVGAVKTTFMDEVIKQMRYTAPLIEDDKAFDIKFSNGILRNGKFIPIDFKEFTPYYVKIPYTPDAEPVKEVDDYLYMLTEGDEQYKNLVLEVLGHTLVTDKEFKRLLAKFFVFVGSGGNGKGTLLEIIRNILGRDNCSSLSIKDMADERYLYNIKGNLANLGDDIEDEPINNERIKILKNISTCDDISIRAMRENSETVSITTSLIFTSNHLLKSWEKGDAYKRRILWLPMYTKPTNKDPKFITKITTDKALEYWVKLVVEGYFRLYENNGFTHSDKVEQFNQEYHYENDSIQQYLELVEQDDFINQPVADAFKVYEEWCEDNLIKPRSTRAFSKDIKEKYNLTAKQRKVNGRNKKTFLLSESEIKP